jgi:hypothetical protein
MHPRSNMHFPKYNRNFDSITMSRVCQHFDQKMIFQHAFVELLLFDYPSATGARLYHGD